MAAETEAVPNPDAQRAESASAPSAADPSVQSEANATQKPKRKYTMSQKALDSRRINIKKALAVPKEILFRSTPKRKESCRTKLIAAREAKRRKREEGKSTGISHGLTCADLRSSLAATGATPAELKAHRQKYRDRFAPQTRKETNLVRGMADCTWRRDEVGHVQAVEDIITTQSRVIVAAEPEQAGLIDFAVAKLAINLFNKGLDLEERLKKLNGRFAHLAYLLLAGRGQAEGFGAELGVKLRWNRSNAEMIEWSAEEMGNPFAGRRKVAKVMAPKTGEMKPASAFGWKGKEKREEERRERIKQQALDLDLDTLENVSEDHPAMSVADLATPGQNVVLVVDGGKTQVMLGERVEGEPVRVENLSGGMAALVGGIHPSQWPEWREGEVAAALRKKYLETSVALRGTNNIGGVTKDDLVQSFLEAFQGRNDERGMMNDEQKEERGRGVEPGTKDGNPSPVAGGNSPFSVHHSSFSSSTSHSPLTTSHFEVEDEQRIRAAAEAAYERVKVNENRSRTERKKLGEILDQVGLSVRETLDQIMRLFTDVGEWFIALAERTAKLKQKVCEMLEARHPRRPENPTAPGIWEGLRPSWLWINPRIKKRYLEDMAILAGPDPVPVGRRKKKQSTDSADQAN